TRASTPSSRCRMATASSWSDSVTSRSGFGRKVWRPPPRTGGAWKRCGKRPRGRSKKLRLAERPHPPELLVARLDPFGGRRAPEILQRPRQMLVQDRRLPRVIGLGSAGRLRHDAVDDLELAQVRCGDPHGAGRVLRLSLVRPE